MDRHSHLIRAVCAALLGLAALTTAPIAAQQPTGRVVGRVIDQQTGNGMNGVSVTIVETGAGALSGVDGRFALNDVPAGPVSVRADNLGFAAKTVTDVIVPAGGAVELNISLAPQALELDAITVTAAAERGSVSRALDQQRNATNIVSAITAEQMSRSPDGDAAAAMQRVSGVTVQDGKFVFVRGLGERYTTTSLNGARVPSPEPERKVVPLDLFPAGLLQTITTSKTFTPDQSGDFSGAAVNIETREFPAERQFTLSLSGGFNSRVTGRDILAGPTVGGEWLGRAGEERRMPAEITGAGNLLDTPPQAETNRLINSFRNAWSPEVDDGMPTGSLALSVGGTDPVFGQRVSYLGSLTYSRGVDVKEDHVRAYALPGANGTTQEIDRYEGMTGTTSVLWGGLAQLSTLVGTKSRLVLNATYNRSSDNEARSEVGLSENLGSTLLIERLRFVERDVFSSQLKGEHDLAARHRLDWVATISGVHRSEPDRSEIVYNQLTDPATGAPRGFAWFSGSPEAAVRTFNDLDENGFEVGANYRLQLGGDDRPTWVRIGGLYRATDRDSRSEVFSISAFGLAEADRRLEPEQIFDGRFTGSADSYFRLTPLSQGGSYTAEDRIAAGYLMADIGLTDRLRVIAGARIESDDIRIDGETALRQPFAKDTTYTDILPALSFNFAVREDMNLRLSGSQTLARPEYRELADVTYREVIDGEAVRGNSQLTRTLIQNADLRWEWYPNPGEAVSIALFGKRFENPIERVYLATSGTRLVTFVNAEAANNYGVEIEVRKRMGWIADPLDAFTMFANGTLMESEIEIDAQGASQTNPTRPMVGQAPWVVNAGLTFSPGSGSTSATLLYNVVGERIVNAGILPLPDVYEEPRHVLDLSLRLGITDAMSAKLDARNLIDAAYEYTQGSVTREYYRTGRSFGLGLSWRW